MTQLLATAFLLVAPVAVAAQVAQETEIKKTLAACATLEIESARLDCYDQLAKAVARLPPEVAESKFKDSAPGKWTVASSTNPVDDTRTVVLALVDDSDALQLALRCQQGKPQVYVTPGKYLGTDSTMVVTRIGEAKAETKRWLVSTNHQGALYPGDAAALITRLLAAGRLVVQVNPFDAGPVTAVFNLGGLAGVVAPLKEACRLP
jgi:type VI secretion system protein VasI